MVLDKVDLQDDGTLGEPILAYALGKDFVVDKETGRMSGTLVNHYGPGSSLMLSEGSKKSSTKQSRILVGHEWNFCIFKSGPNRNVSHFSLFPGSLENLYSLAFATTIELAEQCCRGISASYQSRLKNIGCESSQRSSVPRSPVPITPKRGVTASIWGYRWGYWSH